MRILCSGDLHIGRGSSKIPAYGDRSFSCSATWDRIVDSAIDHKVGLVLLSGDLVDRANRRYEAYGALERGVNRLIKHKIRTCAVAGNHDFDVLPVIARNLDPHYFTLLGKNGEWEETTVDFEGESALRLVGWSFPKNEVRYNPLESYNISSDGVLPVLGMLHTELDTKESKYAPVAVHDLQRQDVALWLLGHIHIPQIIRSSLGQIVLNPGSPQAMDPGECGPHGPYIVEILGNRVLEPVQLRLSSVVYNYFDIDVGGINDELQCQSRIRQELHTRLTAENGDNDALRVASYRIKITGATPLHSSMNKILQNLESDQLRSGEINLHLERIEIDTKPPVKLTQLSEGKDILASLARILLSIEQGVVADEYKDLLRNTQRKLKDVQESSSYVGVSRDRTDNSDDDTPDETIAIECLQVECRNLLAALLAQKEAK